MSLIVAPLMLLTPALPPSGPIWGRLECIFEVKQAQEAGYGQFAEDGLAFEGAETPFTLSKPYKPQVRLVQFPIDGNLISDIEFASDRSIMIRGESGQRILGKLTPFKPSSGDRWWMTFWLPAPSGELAMAGNCLADIRGRLDRPIRLTKIATMRVD